MDCASKVSIIVPVYNTEQYLPKCIESIIQQSYSNTEIILIDDQSSDACPEICDSYAAKDNRIIVIHEENKGVSGARNVGLNASSGEYIMFVDSDDELYPNSVKILMNDSKEFDADIVSGFLDYKNPKGKLLTKADNKKTIIRNTDSIMLALDGMLRYSVCGKIFKKSFISGIFFEEGKNINEDGFFVFQCCLRKPIFVQHNISVYLYYFREGSASRQSFSERYLSMLYFCDKKNELVRNYYPQYINKAYNMTVRTHLQMLDILCKTTDKKYKDLQTQCIKKVKNYYKYHKPVNKHHKILAWVVKFGMFPIYKKLVRLKYYT